MTIHEGFSRAFSLLRTLLLLIPLAACTNLVVGPSTSTGLVRGIWYTDKPEPSARLYVYLLIQPGAAADKRAAALHAYACNFEDQAQSTTATSAGILLVPADVASENAPPMVEASDALSFVTTHYSSSRAQQTIDKVSPPHLTGAEIFIIASTDRLSDARIGERVTAHEISSLDAVSVEQWIIDLRLQPNLATSAQFANFAVVRNFIREVGTFASIFTGAGSAEAATTPAASARPTCGL